MSVLKASGITKQYRSRVVVSDVSLYVNSGEVVGLLGPNGAGKTTCFYMIAGIVHCDKGVIELDGKDITSCPIHVRSRMGIGYLPQEASIFRKLSVADNILAIIELDKTLDASARRRRLDVLLEELHITHIRDNQGMSLSGGERRRVEIARALAMRPDFVLLDEPFAGVDPLSVLDIQKIIVFLSERNIGILITDHNVRETLGICDRAYVMNEGRMLAEGEPQALLANERVKEVYLGHNFRI